MSTIGEMTINAARKRHQCDWCNERIEVGDSYVRYLWLDAAGDAQPTKLHPECRRAVSAMARQEGSNFEWTPGDFARGCCCASGACECEPSEAKKARGRK